MNLAGFEQCAGLLVEQLRRTVRQIALVGRQKRQAAAQHDAARLFSPWMVVTRTVSCSAIDCMTISTVW